MKNFLAVTFFCLLFFMLASGCGKKEENQLQAFSVEAFAYDLGDGWDVNANARVKGFGQQESNGTFMMNVTFAVELVNPAGEKKTVFNGEQKQQGKEKFSDQALEAQFELDSAYAAGKYKVLFTIKDQIGNQQVTAEKEFELGDD
ncbi:MAG: hypothetical protein HY965_01915 [Ignavibacteriales bacterium]|nr:hypothetical protein [Ignavibacteriales bacterium]